MIFPHSRPAAHVVLLLVLTALLPSGQPFAETDQRVIGIGDIHGAYDELTALLQKAQLTDDQQRWSGGRTILVQTGDIIDRGANIRGVLDLLMSLEPQADAAGGKVIALLGNHETMNLMANLRDVAPGAFASFADDKSEERREQAYQDYVEYHAERVEALGRPLPDVQTREQWMSLLIPPWRSWNVYVVSGLEWLRDPTHAFRDPHKAPQLQPRVWVPPPWSPPPQYRG